MKSNKQRDASSRGAPLRDIIILSWSRMEFGVMAIDPALLLLDSNCSTAACDISDCNCNSFLTCGLMPQ